MQIEKTAQVQVNSEQYTMEMTFGGTYYGVSFRKADGEQVGFCGFGFYNSKDRDAVEAQFDKAVSVLGV